MCAESSCRGGGGGADPAGELGPGVLDGGYRSHETSVLVNSWHTVRTRSIMEVWEENSECCEKTPRKQDKGLMTSVSSKQLFLEYVFVLLPGIADRNEFTPNYSLQQAFVMFIYMPLWKKHVAVTCSLSVTCCLPLWLDIFLVWFLSTLKVQTVWCSE